MPAEVLRADPGSNVGRDILAPVEIGGGDPAPGLVVHSVPVGGHHRVSSPMFFSAATIPLIVYAVEPTSPL